MAPHSTTELSTALPYTVAIAVLFFAAQTTVFFCTSRKQVGKLAEYREMLFIATVLIAIACLIEEGFTWGGLFLGGGMLYLGGTSWIAAFIAEKLLRRKASRRG